MAKTKIEWSESVWNPLTGCSKCSEGCLHCYAHDVAEQLKSWGVKKYEKGMEINLHDGKYVNLPRKWRKPKLIFVDSMCDLFHEDVPYEFILEIFKVMRDCEHHIFQILTKRAERMAECVNKINTKWFDELGLSLPNVWMGVTAENQNRFDERMECLGNIDAVLRWVSIEPMLGPIDISKAVEDDILDWVVVGGETAPNGDWREMKREWVIDIIEQCKERNLPIFFKHWNAKYARYADSTIDGLVVHEYPKQFYDFLNRR